MPHGHPLLIRRALAVAADASPQFTNPSTSNNHTMAAAAMGLARELLRPQGTRRLCGTAVGVAAGFLGAATVASASTGGGAGSCPAYPWSPQDGAPGGGGHKVFMQGDCAACHTGLPYAGLARDEALAAGGEVEAKAAEIVVVHDHEEVAPALATTTLHGGGAYPPDLSVITKMLEGLRRGDLLYNADEIKKRMAMPSYPVWLQFLQPYMYMRSPQSA